MMEVTPNEKDPENPVVLFYADLSSGCLSAGEIILWERGGFMLRYWTAEKRLHPARVKT